ncbi:MAG: hypothetical protein Q4E99_02035 [Bacillota bacterium]|nr:hypothetical protein [Bacillota bacterium]
MQKKKLNFKKILKVFKKKIDKDSPELEKRTKEYNDAQTNLEKIEEDYSSAMEAVEEGRKLTKSEKQNLDELDNKYNISRKELQQKSRLYKIRKERKDSQTLDKESMEATLAELEAEERQLNGWNAEKLRSKSALEGELRNCNTIEESYRQDLGENLEIVISGFEKTKKLNGQIEIIKSGKENLERDILNTDVTDFLIDNVANDTVKGISINGKEYLDEDEIKEKGIKDPKLNQDNAKHIKEVQKIVRALKSRNVFKHVNGLNLGEYATYNEVTGKFDLYKGDLQDKEAFEKFRTEFQTKYFKDSNVLTEHLIENDFGTYAKQYACATLGAALTGMKDMLLGGVQKFKDIPKKLSQIPGFSKIVGEYTQEELAGLGNNSVKAAENAASLGFAIKKIVDTKEKLADPQMVAILAYAKVDAEIMKTVMNTMFVKGPWTANVGDIGTYAVAIEKSCRAIAENKIAGTEQLKAMKEMLEAGHNRFASIMKQAANQSKIEEVKGIVDLTTNAVIVGAQAISGVTSVVGKVGLTLGSKIVKGVYSAVKNKQSKEEYLNDPRILGDINYDKNIVSKDEFNQILKTVTGIKSKDHLANALHTVDAIDLLKTAKETKGKNKEVLKSMKAMGFKQVSKWDKVKVADILKKTTGKSMDAKKTLRDATEKSGFHFGSFFQRVWQKITNTKSGRSRVNTSREELLIKNREIAKSKAKSLDSIYIAKGAENIYEMYKAASLQAQHGGKPVPQIIDPDTNKPLSIKEDRERIIECFTKTSVAKKAAHTVVTGFKSDQAYSFIDTAVKDVNEMSKKAPGVDKQGPENQAEQKELKNEDKLQKTGVGDFVMM